MGAMVGNIRVFTMERAVEVYKMLPPGAMRTSPHGGQRGPLSMLGTICTRLGFTWAEIEDMELEAIA